MTGFDTATVTAQDLSSRQHDVREVGTLAASCCRRRRRLCDVLIRWTATETPKPKRSSNPSSSGSCNRSNSSCTRLSSLSTTPNIASTRLCATPPGPTTR